LSIIAIAAVLAHGSQQLFVLMQKSNSETSLAISSRSPATVHAKPMMIAAGGRDGALIIVPEPDPALLGHLLEDRAMARIHLVPLGD
jgi:hypothetical protein